MFNYLFGKKNPQEMMPISGTFDGLEKEKFAKVSQLRDSWANCDIPKERTRFAKEYSEKWFELNKLLENERKERPPGGLVSPFCWRTREGVVIESMCVRMETICVYVAMAEQVYATPSEKEWLLSAWKETRKWICYPNYCLPPSVREDYLALRYMKCVLRDEFGDIAAAEHNVSTKLWGATVERQMDDLVRMGVKIHPTEDKLAYTDLESGGELLAQAYLVILEVEEGKDRNEDEISHLAHLMEKMLKKWCPGASTKCHYEILIKKKKGRYKKGYFDIDNIVHDEAKFTEKNNKRA